MLRRYEFADIFQETPDGALELKRPLRIGTSIYEAGSVFKKGIATGGIDFHLYKNRGIAISQEENSEGPLQLFGFYTE